MMITGVILAHNEERHIVDCIAALRPHVAELLVIDTESADRTAELARPLVDNILSHPNAGNFDAIRNIAIPVARFDWLWFVDADERIPQRTGELVNELIRDRGHEFEAINIPFKSYFCGQWMQHCGWWPGYTVCRVLKRGHFEFGRRLHSGVSLQGRELRIPPDPELAVPHYSFRDLEHYVSKFNRYTSTEAFQLKDRDVQYDWRTATHMMMRDLWEYYELHQAEHDGSLGWILSWMAGQYRWMSHSKLIDLQPRGAASAPSSLDEFLRAMESELAHFRRRRPEAPFGVTLRGSCGDSLCSPKQMGAIARALSTGRRDLVVETDRLDRLLEVNAQDAGLLKALARARPPRHAVGIVCDTPAYAQPGRDMVANILCCLWPRQLAAIPKEWLDRANAFDEIWVQDDFQKRALREGGLAPERIQVLTRLSSANSDSELLGADIEARIRAIESRYCPQPAPPVVPAQIRVELEGELFAGHSFSNINENLLLQFAKDPDLAVSVRRVFYNPTHDRSAPHAGAILGCVQLDLSGEPEVTIRHAFPPNWTRPKSGLWVHIQPWEFGYLPNDWLPHLRDEVDEIWTPSNYVKQVYVASGIPAEKIFLIPWGIDPTTFTSDATPLCLPTTKTFRFLFVGGTIPRKGFDRVLEAYRLEFSAEDDVCLVIKAVGTQTFYMDGISRDQIHAALEDPRCPSFLYLDEELSAGQLASLYTSCQCLVAPYRGEGFGLPVLEAMACGVPAIVPKGGPTDDFVSEDCGYLLNAGFIKNRAVPGVCRVATEIDVSIAELRRVMRRAATNREKTQSLGIHAAQRTHEHYPWSKTVDLMADRLRALTKHRELRPQQALRDVKPACPVTVVVLPTGDDFKLADCLCRARPFVSAVAVVDQELSDRGKRVAAEYGATVVPDSGEGLAGLEPTGWVFLLHADEAIQEQDFDLLSEWIRGIPADVEAVSVSDSLGDGIDANPRTRILRLRQALSLLTLSVVELEECCRHLKHVAMLDDITIHRIGQPPSHVRRQSAPPRPKVEQPSAMFPRYPGRGRGVLIQLAVGPHEELSDLTQAHHRAYADRHGLEFRCVRDNPAAPKRAGWGKIPLILSAMQDGFDRIVWLDADAVIVDDSVDLSQLVDVGVGMARHPNVDARSSHWNSGVMIISRSAATKAFFESVHREPENDSSWMEQLPINALAGRPEFADLFVPLSIAYNSTPGALVADTPVVCAAHGLPHKQRKQLLREWLQTASGGQTTKKNREVERREDFAEFLNEHGLVGEGAEIGVQKGCFSKVLLDRWRGSMLHLIDPWRHLDGYDDIGNYPDPEHELNLHHVAQTLAPHQNRHRIHRTLSHQAATTFADQSLDFVYIDANHEFSSVLRDMRLWFSKVRPGGVLGGHDYLDGRLPEGNFGVKRAVRVFECESGLIARSTREAVWPSWYFLKPSEQQLSV